MIQRQSLEAFTSARAGWCALALAATGCGVDLSLGELDPPPNPPLVDGENPSPPPPVYADGIAPARIDVPEVTLNMNSSRYPSGTGNLSVGDMDGDGFDELAMRVLDDATGTSFIHLRYGSPRPIDAREAFEFSESGARLIVRAPGFPPVILGGVHPVGDFDADGYADVFVQTWADHLTQGNGGYLIYGGPERLSGIHELSAVASHLEPGARVSNTPIATYSFAAPGDIDGDGFDDLAMTTPTSTPLQPGVYVFYGRAERLAAETPWSEAELHLSYPSLLPRTVGHDDDGDGDVDSLHDQTPTPPTLSAGGDIDGDGLAELLVTYTDLNGPGGGVDSRVIVVRGTTTRPTGALNLLELEPQITYPEATYDIAPRFLMSSQAIGDLDGDGWDDFILESWQGTNFLFYGGPELLSAPLEIAQAAATLPGVVLVPLGDRDGDGDDELMAMRSYQDESIQGWRDLQDSSALATVSGSRARLAGNVAILPEPRWEDASFYPTNWERLAYSALSAGDLDNDGATEVITLSKKTWAFRYPPEVQYLPDIDREPQLHIHFGVHVPPITPEAPH